MKTLFKLPILVWFLWVLKTFILILKNKKLSIGYLTNVINSRFGESIKIYENCDVTNISIGSFSYIGPRSRVNNAEIGSFCSIGPDVKIAPGIHPTGLISTSPIFYSTRRQCGVTFVQESILNESGTVFIGNDVWIGANAVILDNVRIGNGAVIAAGSIVNNDVDSYSIVGGVPAKFIKKRFSEEQIVYLNEFKWWDKDIEWIRLNLDSFLNPLLFFKKK